MTEVFNLVYGINPLPSGSEPLTKFRYLFLRRFKNRLKPLLRLREMWDWEYESCERCGSCFKLAYSLRDEVWKDLCGSDDGCLCLNCVIEKAIENEITIKPEDLEWLSIFYGDSPSYDLIKNKIGTKGKTDG